MAKRILNVGIAGLGRSGYDIHAAWLRQDPKRYRIVAVADLMPVRRAEAVDAFGCMAYADYGKLIAHEGLDVFVNALPSNLHPRGSLDALRAGLNVVCEKPVATKVADMDRMIDAAHKAGRVLAPFQNYRFSPFFAKMQNVIASEVLGPILRVRIAFGGFGRRWDWQTRQDLCGGSLNNTGPHPLDHAVMLFGAKTPKVFCRLESGPGSSGDADDLAQVTLHGRGSPTVEVIISAYNAYPPADPYVVSGSAGGMAGGPKGLRWRYFDPAKHPRPRLHKGWSDHRGYCRQKLTWVEKKWKATAAQQDFHLRSKAFYRNLYDALTGKDKLLVTCAQVRRQVAVLQECHRQNRLPKLAP